MKFMARALISTVVISGFTLLSLAQSDKIVDGYVNSQLVKYHVPGATLAVVKHGRVVLQRGYGLANLELNVPARPESVFKIGSITKNFTAAAIMLLVEDGKLALDEKITRYLPDVASAPQDVSVRHLLTHTSGIVDYTDIPGSVAFARIDRLPREVVKPALETPLRFRPGERYEYSNTNYFLLGMIIERVSNTSYGRFLDQRIFGPLKLFGTRTDSFQTVIKDRVSGYNYFQDILHNAEYGSPSNTWSSGGIVSNVLDLARWDIALRNKFFKVATTEQMLAPAKLSGGEKIPYGFGNELYNDRGHRVAGHTGETFGFSAAFMRYVDDDVTVILLCNLGDVPVEVFARRIAGMYLGWAPEAYPAKGIADNEPSVTAMIRSLILSAAKGKVDPELFTPEARNTIVPLIERAGPEIVGRVGDLKSFVLVETRREGEKRVYVYRSVFEKQTFVWTAQLSEDGKIAAIEPKPE